MGADFSKVRSNPLLDYAGVELKQGAVLLDADANELVAIFDRRLRALASDVLGRATVGANTPDAFRITLGTTSTGAQTLLIGPGRLYVDGLLAENHGNPDPAQRVFDAVDGRTAPSASPMPYESQPYLPNPPPLPRAGRHLVYLDVWNREVTHLERPDLVETAVGVETSSRLQTVWQVRVLDEEAGSGTTCGSPDAELAGWADLHRAIDGSADYRHLRGCRGDRSLRAAAHGRLPRPRKPAVPRRDPRSRASRAALPRSNGRATTPASAAASSPASRRPSCSSRLSGATRCCASTAATGWR